jgi:hypothetical protein
MTLAAIKQEGPHLNDVRDELQPDHIDAASADQLCVTRRSMPACKLNAT